MGKKKNRKESQTEQKGNKSTVLWIIAAVVAVVAVLAVSGKLSFTGTEEKGKSFHLTGKETRPVLDASRFDGMTRAAYAAAAKHKDMFNEVYCYCYCDEDPFHHKTLLSCFTEDHGAG